jgi:hypothetical protein
MIPVFHCVLAVDTMGRRIIVITFGTRASQKEIVWHFNNKMTALVILVTGQAEAHPVDRVEYGWRPLMFCADVVQKTRIGVSVAEGLDVIVGDRAMVVERELGIIAGDAWDVVSARAICLLKLGCGRISIHIELCFEW